MVVVGYIAVLLVLQADGVTVWTEAIFTPLWVAAWWVLQ